MRRKGQHFLVDKAIAERIAQYAELKRDDCVLEIGPGTGSLTGVLASQVERVFAVEVDPRLAADLHGRFSNVKVIQGDAIQIELPQCNKIVSNLPYQISSKITYRLLALPFDLAVLMFQREFAERMIAPVGCREYGRLGMVVGYLCDAEVLEIVPRSAFRPMPEVESAIVRLRRRQVELDPKAFMRFTEDLFRSRRKKVKKALAAMGLSGEEMAGLDSTVLERRPEELPPMEAAGLAASIFHGGSEP